MSSFFYYRNWIANSISSWNYQKSYSSPKKLSKGFSRTQWEIRKAGLSQTVFQERQKSGLFRKFLVPSFLFVKFILNILKIPPAILCILTITVDKQIRKILKIDLFPWIATSLDWLSLTEAKVITSALRLHLWEHTGRSKYSSSSQCSLCSSAASFLWSSLDSASLLLNKRRTTLPTRWHLRFSLRAMGHRSWTTLLNGCLIKWLY